MTEQPTTQRVQDINPLELEGDDLLDALCLMSKMARFLERAELIMRKHSPIISKRELEINWITDFEKFQRGEL